MTLNRKPDQRESASAMRAPLLVALILSISLSALPSSAVRGAEHEPFPLDQLIGTWMGYGVNDREPRMQVVFSRTGWMTKTYLGELGHSVRCRYKYSARNIINSRCGDRGLRVYAFNPDTIEFKATDSRRAESIDLLYALKFRRVPSEAQPN